MWANYGAPVEKDAGQRYPWCQEGPSALLRDDSCSAADQAAAAVQEQCYGKSKCALVAEPKVFGGDPCPGKSKHLIAVVKCS